MAAVFFQRAEFIWCNDDNSVPENDSIAAALQKILYLRIPVHAVLFVAIENVGTTTGTFTPELWGDTNQQFSSEFKLSTTTAIRTVIGTATDDTAISSDNFFGLGSAFLLGQYSDDNNMSGSFSVGAGKVMVYAFCVRATAASNGIQYWFRVKQQGGTVINYGTFPTCRVSLPAATAITFNSVAKGSPLRARTASAIAILHRAQAGARAKTSLSFQQAVKPNPNQLSAATPIVFVQGDHSIPGSGTGDFAQVNADYRRALLTALGIGSRAGVRLNGLLFAFQGIPFGSVASEARDIALTAVTGRGTSSSFMIGGDSSYNLNSVVLRALPRQTSWRFGVNNNADPDLCTFGGIEAGSAVALASKFMLRIQFKNVGNLAGNVNPELWVSRDPAFSSESLVTPASADIKIVDGQPLDDDLVDVNLCHADAGFIPGRYDEDSFISPVNLGIAKSTEYQWCLRADTDGNFYFRVKDGGSVLAGGYATYAALRVQPRVTTTITFAESVLQHGAQTRAGVSTLTLAQIAASTRLLRRSALNAFVFTVNAVGIRPSLQKAAANAVTFAQSASAPVVRPRAATSTLNFVSTAMAVRLLKRSASSAFALAQTAVAVKMTPQVRNASAANAVTFAQLALPQLARTSKDVVTQVILSHNRLGEQGTYRRRRDRALV